MSNFLKPVSKSITRATLAATLPSTAKMLTDARAILVSQLTRYKELSDRETFELSSVKAVVELIKGVQMLENQTEREQSKVATALEDMNEDELAKYEAEARKLLAAPKSP